MLPLFKLETETEYELNPFEYQPSFVVEESICRSNVLRFGRFITEDLSAGVFDPITNNAWHHLIVESGKFTSCCELPCSA